MKEDCWSVHEWWEEKSMVILRAGQEVFGISKGRKPTGDNDTCWWNDEV